MNPVIVSNIQTLPTRQNTMKTNRNRGVQRSQTIMNDGGGSASQRSFNIPIDNSDTISVTSGADISGPGTKRKEKKYRASFLKKSMLRKNY